MSVLLTSELEVLRKNLVSMGSAVQESILLAVQALQSERATLLYEVHEIETAIDQHENRIEKDCLRVLARHQPVATDLRRIVAALSIIRDLERMGDLAEHIAERTATLAQWGSITAPEQLDEMITIMLLMVRQSLDAFVTNDCDLARAVCDLDQEVDQHQRDMIAELIGVMKESTEKIEPALCFFSVIHQLERIADHATNIAEEVVFQVEGTQLRHEENLLTRG